MSSPSAITLPSVESFTQLSLLQRARVVGDWLKAQPRETTFNWDCTQHRALAQFAQQLFGSPNGHGGSSLIALGCVIIDVFPSGSGGALAQSLIVPKQLNATPFGVASDAFEIAYMAELAKVS